MFLLKISVPVIAFHWPSDTRNLCHLTVFIWKSVRPWVCRPLACSPYITVYFCYNFFLCPTLAPLTNSTLMLSTLWFFFLFLFVFIVLFHQSIYASYSRRLLSDVTISLWRNTNSYALHSHCQWTNTGNPSPFILSQTRSGFYVSAVRAFRKHCGKRRNFS